MTGRERFLTAIGNGKPDRLPCQVHSWMQYYLNTYLKGMNQFEAYEYFDMDPVIYASGNYIFNPSDLVNWQRKDIVEKPNADGVTHYSATITTPKGDLHIKGSANKFTSWETEHMIKSESDFELFKEFFPIPIGCDWSEINKIKKQIGERGIVRGCTYSYGQIAAWQNLCYLIGTENMIFKAIDEPDWTKYALESMNNMLIKGIQNSGKIQIDLVEVGGGAASSTVISPSMHKEFAYPYDVKLIEAIKQQGAKVVYHLCGGNMPLLETIASNGSDALETMTPPSMGGDCNLKLAKQRVGKTLAMIGGFDQNAGFEKGTIENVYKQVHELFEACPDGGYICSPSDHFFFGDVENLKAFSRACKECKY